MNPLTDPPASFYSSSEGATEDWLCTYVIVRDGATVSKLSPSGTKQALPELSSATATYCIQPSESSTVQMLEIEPELLNEGLRELFACARDEVFEDGMESSFSIGLVAFVRSYGEQAIKSLAGYLQNKTVNIETTAEALRWIGAMHDPITFRYRMWLLSLLLSSQSLRVRDGALLGLAYMDSTKTISVLEKAAVTESCEDLRRDIKYLLEHLRARKQRVKTV